MPVAEALLAVNWTSLGAYYTFILFDSEYQLSLYSSQIVALAVMWSGVAEVLSGDEVNVKEDKLNVPTEESH